MKQVGMLVRKFKLKTPKGYQSGHGSRFFFFSPLEDFLPFHLFFFFIHLFMYVFIFMPEWSNTVLWVVFHMQCSLNETSSA